MQRRQFLKKAAVGGAVAATAAVAGAPVAHAKDKFRWKMVTSWPATLPILADSANRFATLVNEMSEGQLTINVYAGGELVPPLGCFDAVSQGTVECAHSASYYWAGKEPALQWFTSVPFGLNAQGIHAWIYAGGGQKLWEETYAPFNIIPRPGGNTGVQMGGWFNKEINTIEDFKGLKIRIPGLGGKVVSKAGATVVLLPGSEVFTSLERGVLDATEWVGPLHDLRMGFYQAAKFYYYPGWHEPGSMLEFTFNKAKYEALPKHLQKIVDAAAADVTSWCLSQFEAQNGAALQELVDKHSVDLRPFSDDLLESLRTLSDETLEEEAGKSEQARKVHEAFKAFQKQIGAWGGVSEKQYQDNIAKHFNIA